MDFCDRCGTRLTGTKEGLWCPRCREIASTKPRPIARTIDKKNPTVIFVADRPEKSHAVVTRTCPKCGNGKACRWFSTISGEHAGIRRERTVEHFRCTKCSHSWSETS